MKQFIITAVGLVAMAWCSGCTHSQIIARPALQVVNAVQSLAPSSVPARCRTEEKSTGQEWTVLITENVPGEKFEYYAITFRIVKVDESHTEATIEGQQVNSLFPAPKYRKSAPRIARTYADRLRASLKTEKPQPPPGN